MERRFRLCLILTRSRCRREPLEVLRECLRAGVDLVQLREKEAHPREFLAWTREALPICRAAGAPLVVNDSVEVALAAGADGAHLGQEDLPPAAARRILGPAALIGWSTHDAAQIAEAARLRPAVDYVGFGPAFATATKGYAEGLGPARVREAARIAGEAGLAMLAIGGIHVDNRRLLGPDIGLAVCSALCSADDPAAVVHALITPCGSPVRP